MVAMDVRMGGKSFDMLTPEGFASTLYQACRLAPGSGGLAAPVCSSFVFMTHSKVKEQFLVVSGSRGWPFKFSHAPGNYLEQ